MGIIYDKCDNTLENVMGKEHVKDVDINAWITSEGILKLK
jgi:hypothetical protein